MSGHLSYSLLGGLVEDAEIAALFTPEEECAALLRVEAAWVRAGAMVGSFEAETAETAAISIARFTPDLLEIARRVAIDGVPVPGLVAALRAALPKDQAALVHGAMTSQDVMDTGLALRLKPAVEIVKTRSVALGKALDVLSDRDGDNALMGWTRMQAAQPILARDRIATWRRPLDTHKETLTALSDRILTLQLGGAVGDGKGFGPDHATLARTMAAELGLGVKLRATHVMRDDLVAFAGVMSLVSASLGKMGQDIALMAQQGREDIRLAGGGSSSVMAHKSNPIRAELLVSLARWNALQLSGMHQAMLAEQERSGAAWMLEMMVLPGMVMAAGTALKTANALVADIRSIGHATS